MKINDQEIANPGSNKAIDQGCTCAVMDNHHGQGFNYGGLGMAFWISGDCPLHSPKKEDKEEDK